MKLIEALKKTKDLAKKADDLKDKIQKHHAHMDFENPVYGEKQKDTVAGWVQAYLDIVKEIARLRIAIQKTNLETKVTIELAETSPELSIAEWIHWRRDLAALSSNVWRHLNDNGLKDGQMRHSGTQEITESKVIRYYDPAERDKWLEHYRAQPSTIDAHLEVVNATTDLIE